MGSPQSGRAELEAIVAVFAKAIAREMDAMRRRLGSFEVSLGGGRRLDSPGAARGPRETLRYAFRAHERNDKLVPGMECTLRSTDGEWLVRLADVDGPDVTVESDRTVPVSGVCTLVIYPWFLYERLAAAVGIVPDSPTHFPGSALAAFGKESPSSVEPGELVARHAELNSSQLEALRLCLRSSVAFVWGPPGTGKTMTLGHIVQELHARGQRILVTSTTNAAVDQAVAKLAAIPEMASAIEAGDVVRVGRTDAPTHGAELHEVARRLGAERLERLRALESRLVACRGIGARAQELVQALGADASPQLDLFESLPGPLGEDDVRDLRDEPEASGLASVSRDEQEARLRRVVERRKAEAAELEREIDELRKQLRASESRVVEGARVILATMAGLYVNALLASERFDVVIVEEAGMAVLPAVFYCASLSRSKVILVGDPRQLPPIVQSEEGYVRRAMGRSIFDVTVPDPHGSDIVGLLDLQYRMHPEIGSLVSRLYYDGRVSNGVTAEERERISGAPPSPGCPLVLVDLAAEGCCRTPDGSYSRLNERSAGRCVEIAEGLHHAGVSSVAVITPYVEQARLIRRLLAERRLGGVECRTVHGFQGNERDAVILDTVDGEPYAPGVLLASEAEGSAAANLLNVSISRARGKLVVLADVGYYRRRAPTSPVSRLLDEIVVSGDARPWQRGSDPLRSPRQKARDV